MKTQIDRKSQGKRKHSQRVEKAKGQAGRRLRKDMQKIVFRAGSEWTWLRKADGGLEAEKKAMKSLVKNAKIAKSIEETARQKG